MNPMCQMSFSARIVRTFVLNTRHQFIKGSDSGNWTLTDEYNSEITSYSRHHQTRDSQQWREETQHKQTVYQLK